MKSHTLLEIVPAKKKSLCNFNYVMLTISISLSVVTFATFLYVFFIYPSENYDNLSSAECSITGREETDLNSLNCFDCKVSDLKICDLFSLDKDYCKSGPGPYTIPNKKGVKECETERICQVEFNTSHLLKFNVTYDQNYITSAIMSFNNDNYQKELNEIKDKYFVGLRFMCYVDYDKDLAYFYPNIHTYDAIMAILISLTMFFLVIGVFFCFRDVNKHL